MAAYTFEHINRRKADHIKADDRNLLDGRFRAYPIHNYLSGDGKSMVWQGHSFYKPVNRSWQKLHQVRALPKERIPDQIEFQTEDEWRDWQRSRDTTGSGQYCASSGFRNAPTKGLTLSGYAFNPSNMYRTGQPAVTLYNAHNPWPKTNVRTFPIWRGPRGYYGYHHEELDVHHHGGFRYPRDARTLVNDDDIMKYEYIRDQPFLHHKLPVEFPVLQ